jgi:hypothetical protein
MIVALSCAMVVAAGAAAAAPHSRSIGGYHGVSLYVPPAQRAYRYAVAGVTDTGVVYGNILTQGDGLIGAFYYDTTLAHPKPVPFNVPGTGAAVTQTSIRMVAGNAYTGSYTDAAGQHLFLVNAHGFNRIAVPGATSTFYDAISAAGGYVTGNYTFPNQPSDYGLAYTSDGVSYATLPPLAARGSAANVTLIPSAVSDTRVVAGVYIINTNGGIFVSSGSSTQEMTPTIPAGFSECVPQSYTTNASALAYDCVTSTGDTQQTYVQVNGSLVPIKLPAGDSGYPLNFNSQGAIIGVVTGNMTAAWLSTGWPDAGTAATIVRKFAQGQFIDYAGGIPSVNAGGLIGGSLSGNTSFVSGYLAPN